MNLIDTYLMMQQLSAINRIGTATSPYGGTTKEQLSFRSILQNAQTGNTTPGKTISAGTAMDQLFEEAAKKYNVDVNLLKAIGKAESNFNASAISSAGAVGVMQLMPGTASFLGVTNPYDARQNIMGGAKYISQLLNKYDGNVKLALAAYNAGPGNVDKYGGIPPFKETQNYVNRVLNYSGQSIAAGTTVTDSTAVTAPTDSKIEIKTETLLNLLTLMRVQADLKLNSMVNMNDSNNLFSL